jgi:Sulfatase
MMAGNYRYLVDDYHGIHAVVAWGAVLLAGGALAPVAARAAVALARAPGGFGAEPGAAPGGAPIVHRGRMALAVTAIVALLGIAVPPSNATRVELFRQPCAVAPWVLAATIWRAPRLHAPVSLPPSPWLAPRDREPPVPPAAPRRRADPVVVLITVDAVRADAVADPANDTLFPTLTEMKHDGVVFTHAYAPGTQTALSLSTMFSGRYFSELFWSDHGVGRTKYLYPADDPSPRFPELLTAHGVATLDLAGVVFLGAEFGVTRGFKDEQVVVTGWTHARAAQVIDPLLARLRSGVRGPFFAYTHLMEPHEPYDRGRKDGTARERWLSEVAVADAQIGRVMRYLQQRYPKRWALLVSADHGEAFGDHGTFQHGKTLYDELVHVPLVAAGPLFTPRTVDEHVGLVDLGPTLLDLFGVATPATYEGQSLVPLLTGGSDALTRPLIAECRLERSLLLPDGLKVIEDERRKVVEVYDLAADPGETQNLFDLAPARADPALATLRAFFQANTLRRPGYETPFKP